MAVISLSQIGWAVVECALGFGRQVQVFDKHGRGRRAEERIDRSACGGTSLHSDSEWGDRSPHLAALGACLNREWRAVCRQRSRARQET